MFDLVFIISALVSDLLEKKQFCCKAAVLKVRDKPLRAFSQLCNGGWSIRLLSILHLVGILCYVNVVAVCYLLQCLSITLSVWCLCPVVSSAWTWT